MRFRFLSYRPQAHVLELHCAASPAYSDRLPTHIGLPLACGGLLDHHQVTMLVGTGIDIVEIKRIEKSIERFGARFIDRIYTVGEIGYCLERRRSTESFAARFAAKEAGAKALGTGIQYGINWKELEVVRAAGQRPTLQLHGRAAEMSRKLGVQRTWLAITHSGGLAIATVHMEGEQQMSGVIQ